jgi:hypothetical protein
MSAQEEKILHLQMIYYAREYSPARGAKPDRDFITMYLVGKIKNMKV